MPSSTAALRYERSQRDFSGGWSARGSDACARIARVRIGNMQRAVITALQSSSPDPIAESEITHQFVEYLTKMNVNDTQQMEILKNLESTFPTKSDATMEFRDLSQEESSRPDKRRKEVNLRPALLGPNPRESRQILRDQLEAGFYLSYSDRKFRILHRLGSCYNLQGLDYPSYRFMGTELPPRTEYDKICSLCSRKDVRADPEDSSGTCTSSSTDAIDTDAFFLNRS